MARGLHICEYVNGPIVGRGSIAFAQDGYRVRGTIAPRNLSPSRL
jgi:hypothetical protein